MDFARVKILLDVALAAPGYGLHNIHAAALAELRALDSGKPEPVVVAPDPEAEDEEAETTSNRRRRL